MNKMKNENNEKKATFWETEDGLMNWPAATLLFGMTVLGAAAILISF